MPRTTPGSRAPGSHAPGTRSSGSPDPYLHTKVITANPAELRLMLLDGAVRFTQQAHDSLAKNDYEAAFNGITRTQSILLELVNGLRPEHDSSLCDKLSALYTFMYTQLMTASTQRDPALVAEVLQLLQFERETWTMLLEQLAAENRAAAKAADVPSDVSPNMPAPPAALHSIIGGTVSLRG